MKAGYGTLKSSNEGSMQWMYKEFSPAKKAVFDGKIETVFSDCKRIPLVEYMKKSTTITGDVN